MPSIEWWRNHTVKFTSKPHKFLKSKRVITKVQVKENQKMGISGDWFNPCDHSVTLSNKTEERRPKMTVFDKDNNEVVTIDTLERMYKEHKATIAKEVGNWVINTVFPYMVMSGNALEITLTKPRIAGCSDEMLLSILANKGFTMVQLSADGNITLTLPKERFS